MTKLESIRTCKPGVPTLVHCIPAKPSGIQIGVMQDGFVLQINGDEPVHITDTDMKELFVWLRDYIFAEA